MRITPENRCRGYSLVELLIVIAIIGALIALLLPALGVGRESARRTQCISNLRQMVLAAHMHADTHAGRYPTAYCTRCAAPGRRGARSSSA